MPAIGHLRRGLVKPAWMASDPAAMRPGRLRVGTLGRWVHHQHTLSLRERAKCG